MRTCSCLAEKKWFSWKLWILTSSTKQKCVVNEMRFSSSLFLKCSRCTWSVVPMIYTTFVSETFSTMTLWGPSGDRSCKKCAMEYNLGRHQLMRLTMRLGLTHTRVGLKGGGVVGRSFWAHSLRYLLAMGWHFASTALAIGGAWENQGYILTCKVKFTWNLKSTNEKNSIKLAKYIVPINGMGRCNVK